MTQALDPHAAPDALSSNARRMLELRDDVLGEWVERLRKTVKEAEHLPKPLLIDTMPVLYRNIVEAISPELPRAAGDGTSTVASEHGGERARLTEYNAQAVIAEFQLLRWTIFDVLKRNGVRLSLDEFTIVNTAIDSAVGESVTAFALAEAALRERFVTTLTHDLRNPLAVAHASAELIRRTAAEPKIKELSEQITSNLKRMDGMIQELLDAAVFHAGEQLRLNYSHWDITDLASEVCDQCSLIYGPRFVVSGVSVTGWWDRDAIKRAIENLLGNAVKYGASDSSITLEIELVHERMILSVHNEGLPVPPEEMECMFQVFSRAAAARQGDQPGWGIGLPYVRAVAESHGGSVAVDSSVDRGTTFTIDVPRDSRPFDNVPTLATELH